MARSEIKNQARAANFYLLPIGPDDKIAIGILNGVSPIDIVFVVKVNNLINDIRPLFIILESL